MTKQPDEHSVDKWLPGPLEPELQDSKTSLPWKTEEVTMVKEEPESAAPLLLQAEELEITERIPGITVLEPSESELTVTLTSVPDKLEIISAHLTSPSVSETTEPKLEETNPDSPVDITALIAERRSSTSGASVPARLEITEDRPNIKVPGTPNPVKLAGMAAFLKAKYRLWHLWSKDSWLTAIVVISCVASIASLYYFYQNHQILLIGDTYSHMIIARRLIDNLTPGVAQLGGIWLPLPHLLMLLFIWNDTLWQTGLAGSFVSMPCYVVSAVYLFLAARRLTHNSRASFVGTLLFIMNPNILYLQTTPLSELVLIATLIAASYYFLAWAQDGELNQLIWAAMSTFLATLARYDAWALFLTFLVFIVVIGWIKHQRREQIEANLLTFGMLGGLGIVLWLLWCEVIFGDPLYWEHSSFSSQTQQQQLIKLKLLFTYHDLWQSLRTYAVDSMLNVGSILFVLAVLAIAVYFLRRRITPEMLATSAFLVPFVFYVFSLYQGQAALFVPGASPAHAPHSMSIYNARYGVETVAPAALFLAILAGRGVMGRGHITLQIILSIVILAQSTLIAYGGIVSLQEGQYGLDCTPLHPLAVYLAQHYDGGRILADTFTSGASSLGPEIGVDFKNMVYEGSGELWNQALSNPAAVVDWVITNPQDQGDLVTKHIDVRSQIFRSQFALVVQEKNGLSLFQRNGLHSLPTRPVSPILLTEHRLCGIGSFRQKSKTFALSWTEMKYGYS